MNGTRFDGLPTITGPRRVWIGDLMAAMVLAALGMTLAVLVDRSDMRPDERTAFAVLAAFAFLTTPNHPNHGLKQDQQAPANRHGMKSRSHDVSKLACDTALTGPTGGYIGMKCRGKSKIREK